MDSKFIPKTETGGEHAKQCIHAYWKSDPKAKKALETGVWSKHQGDWNMRIIKIVQSIHPTKLTDEPDEETLTRYKEHLESIIGLQPLTVNTFIDRLRKCIGAHEAFKYLADKKKPYEHHKYDETYKDSIIDAFKREQINQKVAIKSRMKFYMDLEKINNGNSMPGDISLDDSLKLYLKGERVWIVVALEQMGFKYGNQFRTFLKKMNRGRELFVKMFPDSLEHDYERLSVTFGMSLLDAATKLSTDEIIAKFGAIDTNQRACLAILMGYLERAKRQDIMSALKMRLGYRLTGLTKVDVLSAQSEYNKELIETMIANIMKRTNKAAYRDVYEAQFRLTSSSCLVELQDYVLSQYQHLEISRNDSLRWFMENADKDMLRQFILHNLSNVNVNNSRVKTTTQKHHANGKGNMLLQMFRHGLYVCMKKITRKDLIEFKLSTVILEIDNKREHKDDNIDREYDLEILGKMEEYCLNEQETLFVYLQREVALRASAVRHLRFSDMFESFKCPKHNIQVKEKGNVIRHFPTSDSLKCKLMAYCDWIKRIKPDIGDACFAKLRLFFPVSGEDMSKVPSKSYTVKLLNRIAKRAGIDTTKVNIHKFRHTLVGHSIRAGVPMQQISQYIGHSSTAITTKHYDVQSRKDIVDNLMNCFEMYAKKQNDAEKHSEVKNSFLKQIQTLVIAVQIMKDCIGNSSDGENINLEIRGKLGGLENMLKYYDENGFEQASENNAGTSLTSLPSGGVRAGTKINSYSDTSDDDEESGRDVAKLSDFDDTSDTGSLDSCEMGVTRPRKRPRG